MNQIWKLRHYGLGSSNRGGLGRGGRLKASVAVLQSLGCVWPFGTMWTIACQAPLSMVFPRQEYHRVLPFSSPGDLPLPQGPNPYLLHWQIDSFPSRHQERHAVECTPWKCIHWRARWNFQPGAFTYVDPECHFPILYHLWTSTRWENLPFSGET